jgi:HEAT repeat protein
LVVLVAGCSSKPPHQGRSVAQLERMLADPDPRTQVQGAYGLGVLGSEAAPAVPALAQALKSPDPLVRQQAATALGEIGPGAARATPDLATALSDPEWAVRRQAAVSIGNIGPPAKAVAEAGLTRCLQDSHNLVRKAAKESLTRIRE